ncbi:MAG: hypothetical protein ACKPA9_29290, partial [Microcystis sp.]
SPKFEQSHFFVETYHPGAESAFRSAEPTTYQHSVLGEMHVGQQCTYDQQDHLITQGPGAGTPDSVSPEHSFWIHREKDVLTHKALGHQEYNQTWTPNQGDNCAPRFQNLNELKNATINPSEQSLNPSSPNVNSTQSHSPSPNF